MSKFKALMTEVIASDLHFFKSTPAASVSDNVKDIDKYLSYIDREFNKFMKNGELSTKKYSDFVSKLVSNRGRNSLKENEDPKIDEPLIKGRNANNKSVPKDASQLITDVLIKAEKLSVLSSSENTISINSTLDTNKIKTETEQMPAPTKLPPKNKKVKPEPSSRVTRSTRTKPVQKNISEASTDEGNSVGSNKDKNDSDVIMENMSVSTIVISDSEVDTSTGSKLNEENTVIAAEPKPKNKKSSRSKAKPLSKKKPAVDNEDVNCSKIRQTTNENTTSDVDGVRSTRTKTRAQQKKIKRSRMIDEEGEDQVEKKKLRSTSQEEEVNASVNTEYEDALSSVGNASHKEQNNATYTTEVRPEQPVNSTMVIENPKIVHKPNNPLMTDDESEEEKARTPPKQMLKTKGTKQIFSPFEKTPLKKKIEAFEKLGADSNIPTRVTRTKTKAKPKDDKDAVTDHAKNENNLEMDLIKHKTTRVITPLTSKLLPKLATSSSKHNKFMSGRHDSSSSNDNWNSALKASQAEFREREKRRQEKEREALKKREAMLQAQTEEKRRKREEKQLKAQQTREALEKEKQKQLESQRKKEERYKQLLAEREEKILKQREEIERKRLLAKKKANDILKEKEALKTEEQKNELNADVEKQNEIKPVPKQIPVYMKTKPPLLPTKDCYDSDDEEYNHIKNRLPDWMQESNLRASQLAQIAIGEKIKNSFFSCQAQTPDLRDIFELIDSRKLKRTSSAMWREPPRYTLMPILDKFDEEDDEDYDD